MHMTDALQYSGIRIRSHIPPIFTFIKGFTFIAQLFEGLKRGPPMKSSVSLSCRSGTHRLG